MVSLTAMQNMTLPNGQHFLGRQSYPSGVDTTSRSGQYIRLDVTRSRPLRETRWTTELPYLTEGLELLLADYASESP